MIEENARQTHLTKEDLTKEERFGVNVDDAVILPLVLMALSVRKLLRAALTLLINIIDYAFPIILGLVRFPLFTLRILGDSVVAILKFAVYYLPVSLPKRVRWREALGEYWQWLRQKLSYKAFEEWVHHTFEDGMAWVFRKCRNLTPSAALLTIFCAALYLPISFGAATILHLFLIANAAILPPWTQLLHPVATIVAKSKLLVLPVYPAAWPQAKKHWLIQGVLRIWNAFMRFYLARKTARRYHQTSDTIAVAAGGVRRVSSRLGVTGFWDASLYVVNRVATWIGKTLYTATACLLELFSKTPLIGALVRNYVERYEAVRPPHEEKFSERVHGFFGRWSIKFSAQYYEERERELAAQHQGIEHP